MSYISSIASKTNHGTVRVGSGIDVTNGVISASGGLVGGDVGYFFSNQTQTNIATINPVTLSNTTLSQGVTLTNSGKLNVSKAGNYTLALMIQFAKLTSAGGTAIGYFWLRKNNIDVADSTTDVTATESSGAGVIASWTYTLSLAAGDYLEMFWSSNLANSGLLALPAQAAPYIRPAAPSVRITVLQV